MSASFTPAGAVPAALPTGWSNPGQTPTSETGMGGSLETTPVPAYLRTSSSERAAVSPVGPVGSRRLERIRDGLSERDWQVVDLIHGHRYLTTRQLEHFAFHDHATPLTGARVCRRVLRRLAYLGVIEPLERRVGGIRAGSASYVWQLGRVGRRLLGGPRTRAHEPSALFLAHTLAVTDAHLALLLAHRAGSLDLIKIDLEPDCWRSYSGLGGSREVLKPDLYVVTGDPSDTAYELRWFIEVDRGTEHPKRLLDKCHRYLDYARTLGDDTMPLVVWQMSSQAAADRLRRAIEGDAAIDARLFRATTPETLVALVAGGAS